MSHNYNNKKSPQFTPGASEGGKNEMLQKSIACSVNCLDIL